VSSGLLRALPRVAALVLALQLVFLALLVAGAAFPDRMVVDRLASDVAAGAYGPSGAPDGQGGRATSFTDCVAAGTGLGAPGMSAFERAVRMPRLGSCAVGGRQLTRLEAGEQVARLEYFRYWAGYTVLTRPVLAAGGMDGMRLVAGGLFGLALLAMVLAVSRSTGVGYAMALTAPLLLSSNVLTVPATAFSHALSLAVAFAGIALAARASRYGDRSMLYAVAVGAATFNFVDLLTTPALPWGLTSAVVAAATFTATRSLAATVWTGVVSAGVWAAAYVTTWVSRWVIAAAVLGPGHVRGNVTDTARFRIDGDFRNVSQVFGAAVVRNIRTWLDVPVMPWIVLSGCAVAGVVALVLSVRRHGAARLRVALALSAPALIPVTWLLVLSNHSQIHTFFVYRDVPVALGILLGACLVAAGAPRAPSRSRGPAASG
jgi:hypothetical protein